eukprot:1345791-Pyramimonas_sp.AAC.1
MAVQRPRALRTAPRRCMRLRKAYFSWACAHWPAGLRMAGYCQAASGRSRMTGFCEFLPKCSPEHRKFRHFLGPRAIRMRATLGAPHGIQSRGAHTSKAYATAV